MKDTNKARRSLSIVPPTDNDICRSHTNTAATLPTIRVHLLGPMRVTDDAGDDVLPEGRYAQALLAYLCLASEMETSRDHLALLLHDQTPQHPSWTTVSRALSEARSTLSALDPDLLSVGRHVVSLNRDMCWIDALAVLNTSRRRARNSQEHLSIACRGELLEGLDNISPAFDIWRDNMRSRIAQHLRAILAQELGQLDRHTADPLQVVAIASRLTAFDPLNERLSQLLMRSLADIGMHSQALQEYTDCRDRRRRALGIEPSMETHALHHEILLSNELDEQARNTCVTKHPIQGFPARPLRRVRRRRIGVMVMPFFTGTDIADEVIGNFLTDSLSNEFGKSRWFDVVASSSSPNRAPEENELCSAIDYLVEGTISRVNGAFEIGIRVIDIAEGVCPVWSGRFEVSADETLTQPSLAGSRLVGRIGPALLAMAGRPRRRDNRANTNTLLMAVPLLYSMERRKYEEAGHLISRALEMDPNDALALAWAGHWHLFHAGQGWAIDHEDTIALAKEYARRSISLDPDSAEALIICGHIFSFLTRDFESALRCIDRSLRINPNLAFSWAWSAPTYCYIGRPQSAFRRIERYRDLAPFDPHFRFLQCTYAIACMFTGDYHRAAAMGRHTVKAMPGFTNGYKPLIASLGHLRRFDEARIYVDSLLRLDPGFSLDEFGRVYPFASASDRERYLAGLRVAGVPER